MLCKNCNTENLLKADYCHACGNGFTQEEKDAAYEKTIFGKFEKLETYISYLSPVEIIKGNRFFRLAVLVIIILYSLFVAGAGGKYMRIEESDSYEVLYNKTADAYYLVSQTDYVDAHLFIPKKATGITVHTVDENGFTLISQVYSLDDAITLSIDDDRHYVIQAHFKNENQSIEVYVIPQ